MATYLGTGAVFEVRSGATSGNKGGGGFNPANTHFPTDGVIAGGTGATPTITPTSSYAFVTNDATVGAWVFFPVQTGVTYPTWAQINTVSGGVATLKSDVGQLIQIINNRFVTNAAAGIASSGTPTLTYGIDYSQANSALVTNSVLTGTTTSCTDATTPFASNHIGNFICISTGTGVTAGWYEITNVVTGTATLDRTAGATYSSCTYYLGGAVSLGGSTTGITDLLFFGLGASSTSSGGRFFIKNGSYTPAQAITTLGGTTSWPTIYEGYNSIRGDRPTIASANQPILTCGSNIFTLALQNSINNITFTGTGTSVITNSGAMSFLNACKFINTSTTAARNGFLDANGQCFIVACEAVSYNGNAINIFNDGIVFGCYAHDSNVGINMGNAGNFICNNIIANCTSNGILGASTYCSIVGNTIYGSENAFGTGISNQFQGATINNIIYGCITGIGGGFTRWGGVFDYNCYYNNTNNIGSSTTGAFFGANDITATNPSFTNVFQVVSSLGTSSASGSILTDASRNFLASSATIVSSRDYVYIVSGSSNNSSTVGFFGITAVSSTTLTLDHALNAGSATSSGITYQITGGRNWLPTGAV